MNITLTITELFIILGFLLSAGATFGGLLWTIYRKAEANHRLVTERQEAADQRLSDFQLRVAQDYVTNTQIERVHDALDQLTQRIDRLITRMDSK